MPNNISRVYSSMFSVLVLGLLISFMSMPNFDLSVIPTNFRWRRDLVNFYSSVRFSMGDKIFNSVVIGKNNWFFLTGDGSIVDYQNTDILKNKKLSNLQVNLDRLNTKLRQKGITLLVVIPPNKSTIYSQYIPEQIPVLGQKSSLDQFVEYMKLNGDTFVLDLRKPLLDVSRSRTVYYKTDTHWNDIGAYYGYAEIIQALALDYHSLASHPMSDFKYTYIGVSVHDLPALMGLSGYKEEDWALIPNFDINLKEAKTALSDGRYIRTVTNTNKQLPRLLVFGDSFYDRLAHFIEPHFSRVKTIPFTYENGIWSLNWIARENPDVVIIEVVERYLDVTLPRLFEN